jgi:hypothetical protein
MRRLALLTFSLSVLFVVTGGAAIADSSKDPGYPPRGCSFAVSSSAPKPGDTITVSGTWPAGGLDVAISIDPPGAIIGRAITGADGTFSARVTIPAAQPLGSANLVSRDSDGSCEATAAINVTKAASGALAFTGSSDSTGMIVAVAAVAVVLGTVLVVTTRRRRRTHSRVGS